MKRSMLYSNRKEFDSLQEYIYMCCKQHMDQRFCVSVQHGTVITHTYRELFSDIQAIGSYLCSLNTSTNHVAILGDSSYEWIVTYLASLYYGVVVIPLDRTLDKDRVLDQYFFSDADIFVFSAKYKDCADYIFEKTHSHGICLDSKCNNATEWKSITEKELKQTPQNKRPEAIAEIIFTSGTTSSPKAVMLSNENVLYTIMFCIRLINPDPKGLILSILPNNHTYELTVGILTPLYFGVPIGINENTKHFNRNMMNFQPTIVLGVPALLQNIKKTVCMSIRKEGRETSFELLRLVSKVLRLVGIDVRRKLFSDILNRFGGRITTIICGGAYLSAEIARFFEDIGIHVIQGYGITECSPLVSSNNDRKTKLLGIVSPYCQVRIEDGEICVKGRNVMLGYYKNHHMTTQVMIDGWFHTGDIGSVDKNTFLSLVGRKDSLIINSNGENINPEEIEQELKQEDVISDCMVYGEEDQIAADIIIADWLKNQEESDEVRRIIAEAVKAVNAKMPYKMHVDRFYIRTLPFDRTSSMKIKRNNPSGRKKAKNEDYYGRD